MNKKVVIAIVSWVIALWASRVFLTSIPYKFSQHPDTQHIFSTIGKWLGGFLGDTIGGAFSNYGPYVVGSFELITSIVLLLPAILSIANKAGVAKVPKRAVWHQLGGLLAFGVMGGAVFFHLFTPLGIEVLHNGQSDGGSLFYTAVSICIGGLILFLINRR